MADQLSSGRILRQQATEVILGISPTGEAMPTLNVTGTPTNPSLYAGIQTGTTVAAALNNGTSLPCTEIAIQAHPLSAINVLIGISISTPFHVAPGDSLALPINNVNKVFIATPSGTSVANWLAVGG